MPQLKVDLIVDDKGTTVIRGFGNSVDSAMQKMKRSFERVNDPANLLGGVIAAFSVRKVVEIADSWTLVDGRLKLVTGSAEELAGLQQNIFALSQETRQEYLATADLYARLARSTKQLTATEQDRLLVTEAINKALIVSGATAHESSAAIIQLSQGLASGELRGEELRSVMEQTPRLARAIADGLGVSIGKLRELSKEGRLTTDVVFEALKGQVGSIRDEFAQMPVTVGQSMTVLNNSLGKFISGANSGFSATGVLAGGIKDLAGELDKLSAIINGLTGGAGAANQAAAGPLSFITQWLDQINYIPDVMDDYRQLATHIQNIMDVLNGSRNASTGAAVPLGEQLTAADKALQQAIVTWGAGSDQARKLRDEITRLRIALTHGDTAAAAPEPEQTAEISEEVEKIQRDLTDKIKKMALEKYEYSRWALEQELAALREKAGAESGLIEGSLRQFETLKSLGVVRDLAESDRKQLAGRLKDYEKFYADLDKQLEEHARKELAYMGQLSDLYRQQSDLRRSTEGLITGLGGAGRSDAEQYKLTRAELEQQLQIAKMLTGQDQIAALEQYKQAVSSLALEFKEGFGRTSGEEIAARAIRDIESAYAIQKQTMGELGRDTEKQIATNRTWGRELAEESRKAAIQIGQLQEVIAQIDAQIAAMDQMLAITADDQASSVIDHIRREVEMLHDKTITITTVYQTMGGGGSDGGGAQVLGSHATGTGYIEKTGLYELHRAESVNTAAETAALSAGGGKFQLGGGGPVSVTLMFPAGTTPDQIPALLQDDAFWRQASREKIAPNLRGLLNG